METNIANMLDQHKQTDVESALSVLESEDGARITMNKVYWMQSHPEVTRNELCQDFNLAISWGYFDSNGTCTSCAPGSFRSEAMGPHLKTDKWGEFPHQMENHGIGDLLTRIPTILEVHGATLSSYALCCLCCSGWSDRLLPKTPGSRRHWADCFFCFLESVCYAINLWKSIIYYCAIAFPCPFLSFVRL